MTEREQVNILMVDDQPAKLLSYETVLADLDENLIKATSGREALEELLKADVAVVLMDVSMPELDGFELAEIIHQHPRFQHVAIIFVSAVHLSDVDRIKGYNRGAVDYVSVPVIPEVLKAKVRVFVELHRKTRMLERLNNELEQRVAIRTEELGKRAEALELVNTELARKNQQLDAVIKTAPDTIFSCDPDGSRDYTSDRFFAYTGGARSSASASGWLQYVHPDDVAATSAAWTEAVASGENYEAEYRLRGAQGEYRWFRARAMPIRDDEGAIIKWYGSCSDIQASKIVEQTIRDNAAQLEQLVDERTSALRLLSGRLMRVQDDERRRLARELHDGLGQDLTAAKMFLDSLIQRSPGDPEMQNAAEAARLVERTISSVRSMAHLLHPHLMDEVGLLSALRWYVDGMTKRTGITASLSVSPREFPRLLPEMEIAIFRIVQEALTNVYRHSRATSALVDLVREDSHLLIRIQDDGKGIEEPTAALRPSGIGIGIDAMRQRVKEFGGELRLSNSKPGTLVEVTMPQNVLTSVSAAG